MTVCSCGWRGRGSIPLDEYDKCKPLGLTSALTHEVEISITKCHKIASVVQRQEKEIQAVLLL